MPNNTTELRDLIPPDAYGYRLEAPSHMFGVRVDELFKVIGRYGLETQTGRDIVLDHLDALTHYANRVAADERLPTGLAALRDVLRISYSPAHYEWVLIDENQNYVYGPTGEHIETDPTNPRAWERYVETARSPVLTGALPEAPMAHSTTYGACEACQATYDSATQAQRTALEAREHVTARITFSYPRDETALVTELEALGNMPNPGPFSDALEACLGSQGVSASHVWQIARLMVLNSYSDRIYRAVVRGQLWTDDRLTMETEQGFYFDNPWLCQLCRLSTCGREMEYLNTNARLRRACHHCLNDMNYCNNCDQNYSADYCPNSCDDDDNYGQADSPSRNGVHDYSYRPHPDFHGEGPLYFGIELETVVSEGSLDQCARALIDQSDSEADYYLKWDGSVYGGFEMVTHPFDLEAWHDYKPQLTKVLATASKLGARSWNQSCCGLHIHASRSGLRSDSSIAREAHLYRIVKLVEDNADPIAKYAGRLSNQWATYDKHSRGISKREAVKAGMDNYGQNRYQAVNLLPPKTIEFRLFRPSLRPETVLAAVELVHGIISYTERLSANACISGGLSFDSLSNWMTARPETYPHAIDRIASRVFNQTPETDGNRD